MSAEEYQARLATALQVPNKMRVIAFENEQGQLQFPAPSPVIQMGNMDLAGRLRPNITNAAGETTESTAVTELPSIDDRLDRLNRTEPGYTFDNLGAASAAIKVQAYKRIFSVPCTEAGGAIAATVIVPAVAGYTGHALINGVYAPAGTTDAASTWAFSCAAGTLLGPTPFTMNITAGRYHAFAVGAAGGDARSSLAIRGTVAADDNKNIVLEVADLAAVGTVYWVQGVYWYET